MFLHAESPRHAIGDETRARLLAAATEVFLEDGFRATRVQDIARRADLRLSAINYHFGGKEGLYRAVLQHHAELAIRHTPLQPPDLSLPVDQRFQAAVRSIVVRMLDDKIPSKIARLLLRELSNPTPALDVLIERFSLPQSVEFRALISEVLGPAVKEPEISRTALSIVGQAMTYVVASPLIQRMAPELLNDNDLVERTTRHICTFSWAGLIAIRQYWENSHDTPR